MNSFPIQTIPEFPESFEESQARARNSISNWRFRGSSWTICGWLEFSGTMQGNERFCGIFTVVFGMCHQIWFRIKIIPNDFVSQAPGKNSSCPSGCFKGVWAPVPGFGDCSIQAREPRQGIVSFNQKVLSWFQGNQESGNQESLDVAVNDDQSQLGLDPRGFSNLSGPGILWLPKSGCRWHLGSPGVYPVPGEGFLESWDPCGHCWEWFGCAQRIFSLSNPCFPSHVHSSIPVFHPTLPPPLYPPFFGDNKSVFV